MQADKKEERTGGRMRKKAAMADIERRRSLRDNSMENVFKAIGQWHLLLCPVSNVGLNSTAWMIRRLTLLFSLGKRLEYDILTASIL
jgi:Lon protease-like protein